MEMTRSATIRRPGEGPRIGMMGDVYRFLATLILEGEMTFQLDADRFTAGAGMAPPPSQAKIEKLLQAALRYGIEIRIPPA